MTTRIGRVTAAAGVFALAGACGSSSETPPPETARSAAVAAQNAENSAIPETSGASSATSRASSAVSEAPSAPSLVSRRTSTAHGAKHSTKLTLSAKVVDVDKAERLLTVRDHNGDTQTIRVGERARNLDRLKAGDDVVVTYYQSTAFQVVPPGQAQLGERDTEQAARAAQGSEPGGEAARVRTVVADIVKLDRDQQEAVLRGSDGKQVTVHVEDASNFDKVHVGDRVRITMTEALAVDVEPASGE